MVATRTFRRAFSVALLGLIFGVAPRTLAQTEQSPSIDITNYKITAELLPDSHSLKAQAIVTLKALKPTQSAVLEMNGSLTISSVKGPDGKTALQFIQDRVNEFNVKVNLGQLYNAGSEITLTFDYSGALATPEGGPIADTRLAYIGPEGSYLFYASRWFPFHGYAADRATSDISLTVPGNWTVAGHSANPVVTTSTKDGRKTFQFVETQPVLPGTFAAGQFITKTINSSGLQLDLAVLPGSEAHIQEFGQEIAQIVQFYNTKFGPMMLGSRFVVAEIDDDTLDYYSGAGIELISHKNLINDKVLPIDDLAREVA